MDSNVKVLGSCRRSGKLYKLRVATVNPRIMTEWRGLPGEPIFNGWRRKTWRKRIIVGHIYFDRWRVGEDRFVHPELPCLEICLFAGVLVEELFGTKIEELCLPNNNSCSSCKTRIRVRKKEK